MLVSMKDYLSLYKKLNIGFLIFHLLVPLIFFGSAFFLKDLDIRLIGALRISVGISAVGFIYYFIFNKLIEKNTPYALYGLFIVLYLYLFTVLDATGGPESPVFFLVHFLIIVSYFVSAIAGISVSAISLADLAFDAFIHQKTEIIAEPALLLPQALSLGLVSIPAFYLGLKYQKTIAEKERMESITERLSSDKNQEEAILSSITDGIYAVDTERNLVLFNKAAEEMTGWDEKSALGLKCWSVMKLKNEQDISVCEKDCPMLQVWNTGENLVREDLCFVNRGRKSVQISGAYSPIKTISGKITG